MNIHILLSTYNGSRFVKQQLESLFAQSYSQVEIIIRDDGSKDTTLDILRDYNVKLLSSTTNL